MWNGFYNIELDENRLKEFYTEALSLSINSRVDIKPRNSFRRVCSDIKPIDFINNTLSTTTHNVAVNRFEYNGRETWADKIGEIGAATTHSDWVYLYIYVSLEVLEQLVDKYKLSKKEI